MGHCKQANHLFFLVCVLFVRSLFPFSNWLWQSYNNMVICNMVLPNCRIHKNPGFLGVHSDPARTRFVCVRLCVCAFRALLCCLLFLKQRLIACSTHSALFFFFLSIVRSFDVLSEIDFFVLFCFFFIWLTGWLFGLFVSNIHTIYHFFFSIHNEFALWKEVEGVNRDNGFCVKYMTPGHVERPDIPLWVIRAFFLFSNALFRLLHYRHRSLPSLAR